MNDKIKNIVSNIIGLIVSAMAITMYIMARIELTQFGVLLLVGLSLFLFKAPTITEWLNKILTRKLQ
jgi:hypothetical protein